MGEGSGQNAYNLADPWDFWNCAQKADVGNGIPDLPRECQTVNGCQIPSAFK